jgi:hypothetical protein
MISLKQSGINTETINNVAATGRFRAKRTKDFSLIDSVQIDSETHPVQWLSDTPSSGGVNLTTYHLASGRIGRMVLYSTPPYVCIAWCLINYKEIFTFVH